MKNLQNLGSLSSLGNVSSGGQIQYLLKDTFSTNLAAGSVNNTQADIGGARTVTDTGSKLSISSGLLTIASATGAIDPVIAWPSLTRKAGRMLIGTLTPGATTASISFGLGSTNSNGTQAHLNFNTAGGFTVGDGGFINVTFGTYQAATSYAIAIVLRAAGLYIFIKGGAFTNWTLLWRGSTGNTSTLFPVVATNTGSTAYTADNLRIPTNLFLPQPLAYDSFTRSNGVLGSTETTGPDSQGVPALVWTGSTWTIASNVAVNTPVTFGSELLTDGGLETWASATDLTSWTETVAGTSTVNKESTTIHGGSFAARLDIDASVSNASVSQVITAPVGTWLKMSIWMKATASGKTGCITSSMHSNGVTLDPGTTYTQYTNTDRASVNPAMGFKRVGGASASLYFDDFTVKALTLSELFSSLSTSTKDIIADVNITQPTVKGIQAGVVINLDSASSPANFVIAYLDGYGNAVLSKCVAGVYTDVISAAVTYSAGATLRVIKDGTSVQLFYNNSKVGSTSTVSDASVKDNVLHGLFSTDSGNTLDNFLVFPRGSTFNEWAALDSY